MLGNMLVGCSLMVLSPMSDRLSPMTVVVTGASTGIGAACALDCVSRGMTVFGGVRDPRAGEALARKAGSSFIPITLDVTDERSIAQSVEVVQRVVGERGLGGLVNNAGIVIGSPLEVIPLPQLRKQLEVNVIGQIAVTQAFLPLLRRGRIRSQERNRPATGNRTHVDDSTSASTQQREKCLCHSDLPDHVDLKLFAQLRQRNHFKGTPDHDSGIVDKPSKPPLAHDPLHDLD